MPMAATAMAMLCGEIIFPAQAPVALAEAIQACAAGLAMGRPLEVAVAEAWAYVGEAIRRAPGLGGGHGPLDHGWPVRG